MARFLLERSVYNYACIVEIRSQCDCEYMLHHAFQCVYLYVLLIFCLFVFYLSMTHCLVVQNVVHIKRRESTPKILIFSPRPFEPGVFRIRAELCQKHSHRSRFVGEKIRRIDCSFFSRIVSHSNTNG